MAYVNLGQVIYPVGAIFASTSSTSPSSMFGGIWGQITGDACLMAGTTIGNIGSKTISEAQMPRHSHIISRLGVESPTNPFSEDVNANKVWYQTLGTGDYTSHDGDYLYTSGGQKSQWITPNAGTRLVGVGGKTTCLTPTDAICGGEQLNSSNASCVTSKTSKLKLIQVLKQFVRSQLEQYTNLLVQPVQPVSMAEDGPLSQMVDSLDRKGLGIILAEKMSINSLLRKCQATTMLLGIQDVQQVDLETLALLTRGTLESLMLMTTVRGIGVEINRIITFPHIEHVTAGIELPNILGGVLC